LLVEPLGLGTIRQIGYLRRIEGVEYRILPVALVASALSVFLVGAEV
jgi:hypothetical protein